MGQGVKVSSLRFIETYQKHQDNLGAQRIDEEYHKIRLCISEVVFR